MYRVRNTREALDHYKQGPPPATNAQAKMLPCIVPLLFGGGRECFACSDTEGCGVGTDTGAEGVFPEKPRVDLNREEMEKERPKREELYLKEKVKWTS